VEIESGSPGLWREKEKLGEGANVLLSKGFWKKAGGVTCCAGGKKVGPSGCFDKQVRKRE